MSAGPRGQQWVYRAIGIILGDYVELPKEIDWPEGWASLSVLVLFSIGLNALLLGIIGEYIGRIFKNVKPMPLVIIDDVIDHGTEAGEAGADETAPIAAIDAKVTRLDPPHKASGG